MQELNISNGFNIMLIPRNSVLKDSLKQENWQKIFIFSLQSLILPSQDFSSFYFNGVSCFHM